MGQALAHSLYASHNGGVESQSQTRTLWYCLVVIPKTMHERPGYTRRPMDARLVIATLGTNRVYRGRFGGGKDRGVTWEN